MTSPIQPTLIDPPPEWPDPDNHNVTDWCLDQFRAHYRDETITKDDIWEYLYGVMHAPDWRERYRHDLQRNLPRVPFGSRFRSLPLGGTAAYGSTCRLRDRT